MPSDWQPSVSRRGFVKASALTTGAFFINTRFNHLRLGDYPASPPTTPFVQPLAFAPYAQPLPPGMMLDPLPIPAAHQRYDEFVPVKYYEMPVREILARPHPQLGLSRLSTYGGSAPGPTFITRCYEPIMVRFKNELPHEIQGFGVPEIITHLHNGNNAPESDGFPGEHYGPGMFKDHHYPNYPANGNPLECKGTLWYHDHTLDFTAQTPTAGSRASTSATTSSTAETRTTRTRTRCDSRAASRTARTRRTATTSPWRSRTDASTRTAC